MRIASRWGGAVALGALIGLGPIGPGARAQGPGFAPPPPQPGIDPGGAQVLTQGPIHEAFAEPVVFDPRPGPVVPRQPPQPVPEVPPDQRPEGPSVQWVPGYWAWDDSRNDFLWVSGIWRTPPPGRQWVPGYWAPAAGGFQWFPGAWVPIDQGQGQGLTQYLPAPPQSLEAGPSSPAPGPNFSWAPGCWVWQDGQYLWRPGYWVQVQDNWLWNPAHYVCTPSGYLYVDGYWDYTLARRGTLFAPVYYAQPIYAQPGYSYTPSISLLAGGLLANLFVRPSYSSYYFGDYYAANNFRSGIYPWYAYHQSRYGYDPLYAYAYASNTPRNPGWAEQLRQSYIYRRENVDARPPRTYVDQVRVNNNLINSGNTNIINNNTFTSIRNFNPGNPADGLALARPFGQVATLGAAGANPAHRFEAVDAARREEFARGAGALQQYRDLRVRQEVAGGRVGEFPRPEAEALRREEAARRAEGFNRPNPNPNPGLGFNPAERPNPAAFAPRRFEMPGSPVVGPNRANLERLAPHEQARFQPPGNPGLPRAEAVAPGRPPAQRFEPHPEARPPHFEPQYHRPEAPRAPEPHRPEPPKGERRR